MIFQNLVNICMGGNLTFPFLNVKEGILSEDICVRTPRFFSILRYDYLKVFWAENKHDAVKKLVHNVSSDEAYRESLLSDDVCLELPFPSDDEYERYFVENDLRYWSVKEYEVEEGSPERKRRRRQIF
jgi:hypothetical protein